MPRRARLHLPFGVYHVVSRCLDRQMLLEGRPERVHYLDLLGRSVARTDARVLAYCLMGNHVHLVLQAGEEPLSRLLKPVHTGFAQWKNRKEGRIGPVFADRFKSILVDADSYLFELIRYVHLNPVRAGLVTQPDESDRSSHRAYLGNEAAPDWLEVAPVLELFDSRPRSARRKYASFVKDGLTEPRRPDLMGEGPSEEIEHAVDLALRRGMRLSHPIVGSTEFIEAVFDALEKGPTAPLGVSQSKRRRPGRAIGLRELIAATCVVLDLEDSMFTAQPKARKPRDARKIITWLWVHHFGGRQAEIGRYLNAGSDLVSRWYSRAIEDFEAIEPVIDQVLATFPETEPALASRPTDKVVFRLEVTDP